MEKQLETYEDIPQIIAKNVEIKGMFGIYLLYMPISLMGSNYRHYPTTINEDVKKLVNLCINDFDGNRYGHHKNYYVYLSFETSYVKKGVPQKRPGWHCDGFKTEDTNYIWFSDFPTIFNPGPFLIDPTDHNISMTQFNQQVDESKSFTESSGQILKLSPRCVHKAAIPHRDGVRTFIKVSFSQDKYNLKGNTINPLLKYDWKFYDRQMVRNHPQYKETDSFPEVLNNG